MNLTLPIFTDPEAAREHFEAILWPKGAFARAAGSLGGATPPRATPPARPVPLQ